MMEEDYRVGCFNGSLNEETAEIRHDSMEEPLEIDIEELHDLTDIVSLLHLRIASELGDEEAEERLGELVRELEAQ